MRTKRVELIALLIMLAFLATACAGSFVNTARDTLDGSKTFYDLAMTTVADLQAQGKIDVIQRGNINHVAKIYKEAHNAAVDALLVYKKTQAAADKDKVLIALANAAAKWAQVAKLINAIKPGAVPEALVK